MPPEKEPFDPYTYPGSQNVEVLYGVVVTVAGVLLFAAINMVTQITGPPSNLKGDVWRWRNTFVSWNHAGLVGLGVLYSIFFKPEIFDDLILYCDYEIYILVAFSLGYFFYDVIDHVLNNKHLNNWEVMIHHICVIWTFCYHIQYRVNVAYTIIALLTEVNSIFLHARKLMQMTQWPFHHWLYRFVLAVNLLSFVVCRLYAVMWVSYGVYQEWSRLTVAYRTAIVTIMCIMSAINPVLLWRLVKNDLLRNIIYMKRKIEQNGNGARYSPRRNGEFRR